MTAAVTREHVTADELVTIALQRLDRVALRIALSDVLSENERHTDIGDLNTAYWALRTYQRLYPDGA